MIRGFPAAGVRSTADYEAVVTLVRPQLLDMPGLHLHARACSALDAARHRPASTSIKRRGNAFATERCPLGTRAEDGNDARPEHATAKPQPPCGERPRGFTPATTSASAGSGHPAAPQTRKPRYSAVSQALCRTRTGDPFLTMAVRPGSRSALDSRKTCREAETIERVVGSVAQRSAPALPTECPGAWQTARQGKRA